LASLLFGDAFRGLQLLDILLLGGLLILGLMVFRLMRGHRSRAQPEGASPYGGDPPYTPEPAAGYSSGRPQGGAAGSISGAAPPWFEPKDFVTAAKTNFLHLQAAWDKGDFRDIRDYASPELFAELQREYDRLGRQNQYTEVLTLNTEVLESRRDGDQLLVSVLFTGLIREQHDAEAGVVSEIWHLSHGWASPDGNWFIVGIQQTER
jgi:predicted lipid-binding transport protein (Tim44 family)